MVESLKNKSTSTKFFGNCYKFNERKLKLSWARIRNFRSDGQGKPRKEDVFKQRSEEYKNGLVTKEMDRAGQAGVTLCKEIEVRKHLICSSPWAWNIEKVETYGKKKKRLLPCCHFHILKNLGSQVWCLPFKRGHEMIECL